MKSKTAKTNVILKSSLSPKQTGARAKATGSRKIQISPEQLRAWWFSRQGLAESSKSSAESILERSGWARSVGGASPYLTFHSRGHVDRVAADKAVSELSIHELPSARGCTYVVPASDFSLALKVGESFGFPQEMRVASKLGVTEKEIDKLCDAVTKALGRKTLSIDMIREAVGSAARSLGEAGKKKGLQTTLPLAIGRLQSAGVVRRVPQNGRLDQQRYNYALWPENPLKKFRKSLDESFVELARKYFRWIGPATLDEFGSFAGLSNKAANAAVADLGLASLPGIEGRLMYPEDLDELLAFRIPKEPRIKLVGGLDSMLALRRDLTTLLDSEDQKTPVMGEREKTGLGTLSDLSDHAIFDRGRLIGLWLYDFEVSKIVWFSWVKPSSTLKNAVLETETFVREQLGDARMFSLDSTKSRQPRIDFIRKHQPRIR